MPDQPQILRDQYDLRFTQLRDYRNKVWTVLCNDYFSQTIPATASVLDVGAGWGEFINNIPARTKYAMDLNPATGENLADGISFIHQDCSEVWPFSDNTLDVIFTSNFLEHLPNKSCVERTIREAHRCLKEGGRLICMGPNMKCVPGEYWDFWDHNLPFTELSISELLRMNGFEIKSCISRFLPYSMSTGSRPPLLFARLYLQFPLCWRLFGKQLKMVTLNDITGRIFGGFVNCSIFSLGVTFWFATSKPSSVLLGHWPFSNRGCLHRRVRQTGQVPPRGSALSEGKCTYILARISGLQRSGSCFHGDRSVVF